MALIPFFLLLASNNLYSV